MAKPPYMPLYVDDYEADTPHLTLEEDGVYNRLLRLCWRTSGCSVPDDPKWIARKMRVDLDTYHRLVEPIIREFFRRESGRIFQGRQRREFQKATEISFRRSEAGRKGGRPSKTLKNKDITESQAKANEKQTESIHTITIPYKKRESYDSRAFDAFWAVYPRRIGKRAAAEKFRAAVKSGVPAERITEAAGRYSQHCRDNRTAEKYIKHPATWLNQGCWDDELRPQLAAIDGGLSHDGTPAREARADDKLRAYLAFADDLDRQRGRS